MKRDADLLVGNEYIRIKFWDVLSYKKYNPEFWESHKDKCYSTHRNPNDKKR